MSFCVPKIVLIILSTLIVCLVYNSRLTAIFFSAHGDIFQLYPGLYCCHDKSIVNSFFMYLSYLKHFIVGSKDPCFSSFIKFAAIILLLLTLYHFLFPLKLSADVY